MKVSPITTKINNTNFKSKLPSTDYNYSEGFSDYWETFANICISNGKQNRLKNALTKLKENGGENLLALTYSRKTEKDGFDGKSAYSDVYTFSLHPERKDSKFIDMNNSHSNKMDIFIKNMTIKYRHDPWSDAWREEIHSNSINSGCKNGDNIYERILKIFESIVEKGSENNKLIFGETLSKGEQLLKEFRV